MKKIYKIGLGILGVLVVCISIFSFVKSFRGEWVCIAENCDEWIYGDEWISANCRPENVNGEQKLTCKLNVNDREYAVPLEIINISNVRSCKRHSCVTEVFVRKP